jgi:hypothetical protein
VGDRSILEVLGAVRPLLFYMNFEEGLLLKK